MRFAAILLVLSGCASPSRVADASRRECYALEVGEWSRPWPAEWSPPRIVRLHSAATSPGGASGGPSFALRPDAPLPRPRGGGGSAWRPWPGDSIQLVWAGDWVRLEARVQPRGEEVTGWIRGTTDVVTTEALNPVAPVRGRRVECPATL